MLHFLFRVFVVFLSVHQFSYAFEEAKTYILFAIDSDDYIEELTISGEETLHVTKVNTDDLITYYLLEADEGSYYFSRIKTGLGKVKLDSDYSWEFEVVKNKVNYAGHMEINREYIGALNGGYSHVALANKSSFAIEYLKKQHPLLFDKKSLVYQGPGKDDFIAFYLSNYFTVGENNP